MRNLVKWILASLACGTVGWWMMYTAYAIGFYVNGGTEDAAWKIFLFGTGLALPLMVGVAMLGRLSVTDRFTPERKKLVTDNLNRLYSEKHYAEAEVFRLRETNKYLNTALDGVEESLRAFQASADLAKPSPKLPPPFNAAARKN